MRQIIGLNRLVRKTTTFLFLTVVSGCSSPIIQSNPTPTITLSNSHEAGETNPVVAVPAPPSATPAPSPTTAASPPAVAQNGCLQPNSKDYIYGNYSVEWTLHGDYYKSLLQMKGGSGKMLTEYFNPRIKGTDIVLQTMTLQACSFGLVMIGSNPLYPKTLKPHPNYATDGLAIRRQPNGKVLVFVCDTAKNCSAAQVRRISG